MTTEQAHHWIVEHIWRFLRASCILIGMVIWLSCDNEGMIWTDWVVLGCGVLAHMTEQFHGFLCNRIAKVLHWKQDFNSMD